MLFPRYPTLLSYFYLWCSSLMKYHFINETFPDHRIKCFSTLLHEYHSFITLFLCFSFSRATVHGVTSVTWTRLSNWFTTEHFHHQFSLMFIFYLQLSVFLILECQCINSTKVAFYEQNIFWADTTVWRIPLLYLNEFCPSYLIDVITVENITLPIFSTFDTNLCLCFSTFGSFAPYPSYSLFFVALLYRQRHFPLSSLLYSMCCDASLWPSALSLSIIFSLKCYPFNINKFTLNCCHRSFAAFLPDISAIYQILPNFHFTLLFCDHTEMRCERIKW